MKSKSSVILILSLWLTGMAWLTGSAVAQHDWDSKGHPDTEWGRMHNRMMAPSGTGWDRPGHRMKKGGGIRALLRHAQELDLSDSQVEQLENLQFEFKMASIDQEAAIKKAQVKLKRIKQDDAAPEAEVMEAIDLAAGAKAEMAKMQYSHRREIMASLTEKQREKLDQLRMEQKSGPDGDDMKKRLKQRRKSRSRTGG